MLATIILSILLLISIAVNIAIGLIAKAQYVRAQRYESMIIEFGDDALSTYEQMKTLDDRQWFEKDDDVGIVFQDLVNIIEKFNERTQARTEK